MSIRPCLYHLTSPQNFDLLLETRRMRSTADILHASGDHQLLESKRYETLTVIVDDDSIDLRDQQPLYEGKASLEGGWTFADLIRTLNEHVFFWPGWTHKPVDCGTSHFEKYESDGPVIFRVRTEDMLAINHAEPFFCKYNSGSPRTTQGKGSPRGPNTFVRCHEAAYTASNVVELTYRGAATLPDHLECSFSPAGPWTPR